MHSKEKVFTKVVLPMLRIVDESDPLLRLQLLNLLFCMVDGNGRANVKGTHEFAMMIGYDYTPDRFPWKLTKATSKRDLFGLILNDQRYNDWIGRLS